MNRIKVFYDETGQTLTIWFGDPAQEDYAEEFGDEIIAMKSKEGAVFGIETRNVHFLYPESVTVDYAHAAP